MALNINMDLAKKQDLKLFTAWCSMFSCVRLMASLANSPPRVCPKFSGSKDVSAPSGPQWDSSPTLRCCHSLTLVYVCSPKKLPITARPFLRQRQNERKVGSLFLFFKFCGRDQSSILIVVLQGACSVQSSPVSSSVRCSSLLWERCPSLRSCLESLPVRNNLQCHTSSAFSSKSLFATGASFLRITFKRKGFHPEKISLWLWIFCKYFFCSGEWSWRMWSTRAAPPALSRISYRRYKADFDVEMRSSCVKTPIYISTLDDHLFSRQGQREKLGPKDHGHGQCDPRQDDRNQVVKLVTFLLCVLHSNVFHM